MNKLLIILIVGFGTINILYGCPDKKESSFSKSILYQLNLEKELYDKLAKYLKDPKNKISNKDIEDLLSDYDTALMGFFDLAVEFNQGDEQYWIKLNKLYLRHMADINYIDVIEGWPPIGEFLKKKVKGLKVEKKSKQVRELERAKGVERAK